MAEAKSFKVGEAPWEQKQSQPQSFPVGQAPWEQQQADTPQLKNAEEPGFFTNLGRGARSYYDQAANFELGGYLPQAEAIGKQVLGLHSPLWFDNHGKSLKEQYLSDRDNAAARLELENEAYPDTSKAGKLTGALLASQVPIGEMKSLENLPLGLEHPVRGLIQGAEIGGGVNPGDKPGVLDPLQLDQRAENAVHGAGLAAGTAAVTGGARGVLGFMAKSPQAAEDFAATKAFKGSGAMLKDFRQANARDQVLPLGNFALDKGLIKAGDTVDDVAEKATQFNKGAGDKLSQIYSQANDRLGKLSNEGPQPMLSGMTDDLQRTVDKPMQVELNGKAPAEMRPQTAIPTEQTHLAPLPQGEPGFDQKAFPGFQNQTQTDALNAMSKGEISSLGKQAEISGAEITPRSYANASVRGVEQMPGQSEMMVGAKTPEPGSPKAIADAAGFNPVRDKEEIMSVAKKYLGKDTDAQSALKKLGGYIDSLAEEHGNKTLDPRTANEIKSSIDEAINYSRNPLQKNPANEKAFSAARSFLSKKISDHIDAIGEGLGDPEAAAALKQANKEFGYSRQLQNIANDRVSRESANRMFGLTDTIVGSAAGAAGAGAAQLMSGDSRHSMGTGLALGLLGAGANKLGRTYGNGLMASGGRMAAPALRYSVAPIARTGEFMANPEVLARMAAESKALKEPSGFLQQVPPEAQGLISTPAQYPVKKKAK